MSAALPPVSRLEASPAPDYRDVLTAEQIARMEAREVPPWLVVLRAWTGTEGLPVTDSNDPFARRLAQWVGIVEDTPPGQPIIVMAPSIARALESAARTVGIFGPVGTGKSRQVCSYVYAHCRKYAAVFPGHTIRWLFVRDTYEAIRKSTLETWLSAMPPGAGRYNKNEKTYTLALPKGQRAECLFWGLDDDQDVNKLPSLELSGVVIEEPAGGMDKDGEPTRAVDEEVYWNLLPRLRQPRALQALGRTRCILVGNPPMDTHWCHDLKATATDPGSSIAFIDVPLAESPMAPSYYADLERDYARRYGAESPYARRYIRGEWLPGLQGGQMRPEDVPRIRRAEVPALRGVVATCDPATGVGKDRSVIAVGGVSDGGIIYLLDLRVSDTWSGAELEEQIFEVQERSRRWAYPPISVFGIEAVGFQEWLASNLTANAPRRGTVVPIRKLKRDTRDSKAQRIVNGLGSRIAQGRLVVVEDCPNLEELWREMRRFNPRRMTAHDDILDALSDFDEVTGGPMVGLASVAHWGAATEEFTRESFWRQG